MVNKFIKQERSSESIEIERLEHVANGLIEEFSELQETFHDGIGESKNARRYKKKGVTQREKSKFSLTAERKPYSKEVYESQYPNNSYEEFYEQLMITTIRTIKHDIFY